MHKTTGEAVDYVQRFLPQMASVPQNVRVVLCPPFTALAAVGSALRESDCADAPRVALGAQTMHWEAAGAYTGEISPPMLLDLGVSHVIVGHSERRVHFGETDEFVRLKTRAALENGLTPIVAVGEPAAVREAGGAGEYVTAQVRAAVDGLSSDAVAGIVLAYEPIWSIGTGQNCDPADANAIMRAIRDCLPALRDVPILYGGSVKPDNIASYTQRPDIDGGLVGGASLDPAGFASLCAAAA